MDISDLTDVLRRRLTEARTTKNNSMLLVAGSGVSVQATKRAPAASWGGLLRSGLELCKQQTSDRKKKIDAAAVETMLAAKKVSAWINAATVIERTLRGDGGTVYEDWLSETVGALRPTQPEVLRAIAELGIPVATTNYDGLLEHELESQPITWRTHGLVDLFLGGTYPGILHLHGHFAEPQSVVLGASSYDKIATDPRAQDTMRHLLRNRDLIFVGVGAGLEDPNFGALLNWAKDVTLPDARYHFLLVRQEDARELRAKLPLTLRIHVIVYGQDHEHLAPFLRNLIGPAQAASQPSESERFSVSGSTSVDTSRPVLAAAQMEIGLQALQRLFHDWAPSVADRLVEAATALRATSSDNATEYRRVLASLDEIVHDVLNISFFTAVQRASEGAPEPRYLARPPSPGAMPFGSTNESVLWPRRDDLVKEVNRLLAKRQLLFVTGPSSSGKTSLILGVLKENTRYANFTYCSLRDGDPEHLVKELPVGTQAPLLVIDHVEELFSPARPVTASSTTDPRQTLCAALFGGAEPLSKKSIVILIIREDRLRELAQVEGLSTNMSATIRVPMLSSKELKEMLQHQLRNAQLKAEEGLLDRLEIDLDDAPGRMCLAQRSLVRLYQHRRGYRLRLSEYQEFARPSTLLLDLANEFLADCQVAERQYVRYVLLRLGGYAIGKHTLSQVYPVDELLPVEQRSRIQLILESMIRAGLLVLNAADEGSGSSAPQMTVEAAHPALIQHWGEVESWRKIDQDALTLRERLREDARSWRRAGQDPSYLSWRGSRLHAIGELVASGRSWLALNEQEEIFYHACRNAQTPEDAARHEELVASQRLAAFARSLTEKAPHLLPHSVLLAAEAVKRTPRPMLECNQALHQATVRLLRPVSRGCLLNWAPVDQLRFSPDGRLLATQSRDATVRVFNVRDGRLLNAFYHADGITAMHFSPSGQHLATSSNDGRVRLFDAKLLKEVRFLQHSLIVTDFAFTVDGHHLVSACLDGIVRQWAVESGQIELELTHEAPVMSVALSTSGRRLATRCGDRKARVFELPGGKKLAELAHEAEIEDLVFSPNGEYLVSTTTEAVGRELDEEDKLPSALRFARKLHEKRHPEPQTSWIIAQETSNPVHFHRVAQLWEVGSLAPPRRLAHSDRIEAVRFSPDSTRVATASRDQTVRLWHIPSGLPLQQLDHDGPVSTVEFSPDGRHLASACMGKRLSDDNDFTVRLWDTKDGTEVARASHESSIFCIAFSTDGRYLATGGADETARLWNPVPHVSANGKDITWCFSSDATYLASWSQQASSFRLQAIRTEREPLSLTIHCKRATFAANGKHLFLLGAVEIHCIRLSNWGQQNLVPLASAQDVYLSEKEDVLYVLVKGETDAGSSLHLWDMDLGKTIAHVELGAEYESLSYIADRETILVTGKSKLAIVSAQSGSVLSQAPSLVDVDNIFSSPRGAHIISLHRQGAVLQRSDDLASVASLCGVTDLTPDRAFLAFVDGTQVEIWDTERGVRVERWPLTGIARRLKLAANGRRVVVYLEDGSLHAFSSETKRQIASVSDDDAVDALAVSNDGCWLAIATSNAHARRNDIHQRRLQLHNLETTQPPRVLYVEQTLAWLGFTADHRHLVGLNDSIYARTSERAYFWEIDTGQLVMELPTWGRNAPGQDEAAISPDLRFVAARVGREVVLYGWQTNDLLAAAKKRLCRNFTEDEWRRYFPEQPYAETFPGLPLPIDSLMEAKKLAQEGDVDGATQRFRNLLSLDANLQFDPDLAARWLAAVPHLTRARAAAGQPEEMPDDPLSNVFARMSEALGGGKPKPQISPSIVEDCLRKARELVPTLDLDDQQVIATVSFSKSLKEGESLAIQGKIAAAAQQFQAAYEVAKSVLSHLGNAKALLAPDFDAERMADLIYYTSQRQEIWLHAIDPNDFERRMETLAAKLLPEITKIAEQRRSFESMLFITQGDEAAKQGDLATATAAFESALRADPSINIGSPSALAQLLVGQTMSATVRNAVRAGNVSQALTVTEELMKLQTPAQIGGDFFNTVAWYGALHGGAAQVLFAADLAIKLSPEEPAYYDTRAVVRLLMQDRTQWPAAITDLQPVVHAAPSLSLRRKRAEWIKSLRAGVDPLTPEILSLLKKES